MIGDEDKARAWISAQEAFDPGTISKLERFSTILNEESQKQNLVSAKTLDEVWVRHFVDSLQLLLGVPRETSSWLDLGTGAGFPGVAVAIARPDIAVTCVESRALRTDYLARVVADLALANCEIIHSRVQDVQTARYGVISARAFAPLPKLLNLSTRFSTQDTEWRLPKGRSAAQELEELRGWDHMFHVEQSLTDGDAGIICGRLIGRKKGKRS